MSKYGIPILMYHALVRERYPALNKLHITTDAFTQQILWLAANGYTTITIDKMLRLLRNKKTMPAAKYCIITFDDGYRSLFVYALPLLAQLGFTATLFLTTGITGSEDFSGLQDVDLKSMPPDDRPLTNTEINALLAAGWNVQAHSTNHKKHTRLLQNELQQQVAGSKEYIEQVFHVGVQHYAYPFGAYNKTVMAAVKQAGYATAASVHSGLCNSNGDLFRLPRLEINSNDSLKTFATKVKTGHSSNSGQLRTFTRNILFKKMWMKKFLEKIFG